MPGWIFVSALLAAMALFAAVTGRPAIVTGAMVVAAVVAAVTGALLRPDRDRTPPIDQP
jgi:hypothetical protein